MCPACVCVWVCECVCVCWCMCAWVRRAYLYDYAHIFFDRVRIGTHMFVGLKKKTRCFCACHSLAMHVWTFCDRIVYFLLLLCGWRAFWIHLHSSVWCICSCTLKETRADVAWVSLYMMQCMIPYPYLVWSNYRSAKNGTASCPSIMTIVCIVCRLCIEMCMNVMQKKHPSALRTPGILILMSLCICVCSE